MATETKKTAPKAESAKGGKDAGKKVVAEKIPTRLKAKFHQDVIPSLMKKFNYKSVMEVPALHKIVINIGVGDAIANAKLLEDSVRELGEITGQKPIITKSKKSIARTSPSAAKSRCAAKECTSSSTNW